MCGRYAASADLAELVEEFDVDEDRSAEPTRSLLASPQQPPPGQPDHNMAPTKLAPVVLSRLPRGGHGGAPTDLSGQDVGGQDLGGQHPGTHHPSRQLRLLSWGLVPSWSKAPTGGARMINARAESAASKPAFSRALAARRCLVPAEGWYEWQVSPTALDAKGKARKQPFFIHRADDSTLAMAGLYEFWRDPAVADPEDPEAWLVSFAILTTAAEPGLDRIHDRQPLVLDAADWDRWLDPSETAVDDVADLLRPQRPGRFTAYPVSRAVGSNRANGAHLLDPAPAEELEGVVDPMTGEVIGG